LAYILQAKY